MGVFFDACKPLLDNSEYSRLFTDSGNHIQSRNNSITSISSLDSNISLSSSKSNLEEGMSVQEQVEGNTPDDVSEPLSKEEKRKRREREKKKRQKRRKEMEKMRENTEKNGNQIEKTMQGINILDSYAASFYHGDILGVEEYGELSNAQVEAHLGDLQIELYSDNLVNYSDLPEEIRLYIAPFISKFARLVGPKLVPRFIVRLH